MKNNDIPNYIGKCKLYTTIYDPKVQRKNPLGVQKLYYDSEDQSKIKRRAKLKKY